MLGFEKQIKHLDGHLVNVSKISITQPGDVIKISGEGMPVHQSSDVGDLFVRIDINFPIYLTEEQKESKIKFIKFIKFNCIVAKLFVDKRKSW